MRKVCKNNYSLTRLSFVSEAVISSKHVSHLLDFDTVDVVSFDSQYLLAGKPLFNFQSYPYEGWNEKNNSGEPGKCPPNQQHLWIKLTMGAFCFHQPACRWLRSMHHIQQLARLCGRCPMKEDDSNNLTCHIINYHWFKWYPGEKISTNLNL